MEAYKNKYLKVPGNIVLNKELDKKLVELDNEFKHLPQTVTSGVRTPEDQLRIIRNYLQRKGLSKNYPECLVCDINDKDNHGNYKWQMGWSALLNIGVIINPPLPAPALMDYIRGGINKKGQIIGQSPHTRGTAFDVAGLAAKDIFHKLLKDKKIRNYLVERENNAIHVDI